LTLWGLVVLLAFSALDIAGAAAALLRFDFPSSSATIRRGYRACTH